jgi:saccharopine dehydrogenase-like NADP-dependent oxidoreductase
MNQILILGAGLVAAPLVEYLHRNNFSITLASQFLEEAQALSQGRENIKPVVIDVGSEHGLAQAVQLHQIVVSFLPFELHPIVAKQCLKYSKHMVTASYRSDEMAAFDDAAKSAGITILNEMGFDPGLDHLSAMSVINEVQKAGGRIESFISWGAGLPSMEDDNNPFHYKFSWSPKSVLLALKNEARYLNNKKIRILKAKDLISTVRQAWVDEAIEFEGYPNRDSVPYREAYGLNEINNLIRGTLRYPGHLEIMREARDIGLLKEAKIPENISNWRQLIANLTNQEMANLNQTLPFKQNVLKAFEWAGMLDENCPIAKDLSIIDNFCELLRNKLVFSEGERDLSLLVHKFVVIRESGKKEFLMSKLKVLGDKDGHTAMSKCVGTPAAIATKLILDGKVSETGSIIPVSEEYYSNMLPLLHAEGLSCVESNIPITQLNFLKEINH